MRKRGGRPAVPEIFRPWGRFRQYLYNRRGTVSLMEVKPGQRLSLQSHRRRSELWIVLDEGAEVTVGARTWQPDKGEEIFIAAGEKHRLGCTGREPVRVLEVASGRWNLNDIRRYADDYNR